MWFLYTVGLLVIGSIAYYHYDQWKTAQYNASPEGQEHQRWLKQSSDEIMRHVNGIVEQAGQARRDEDAAWAIQHEYIANSEWFKTSDGIAYLQTPEGGAELRKYERNQRVLAALLEQRRQDQDQAREDRRVEYIDKWRDLLPKARTPAELARIESELRQLGA